MENYLIQLGFTLHEAKCYITLLEHDALNGYEVSKLSGIPRANAYSTLESMYEKGYVYRIDEKSVKYIAKDFMDLSKQLQKRMEESIEYLRDNLSTSKVSKERFMSVEGKKNIMIKIREMIDSAEELILIDLHHVDYKSIKDNLKAASDRDVAIYLIVMGEEVDHGFSHVYYHEINENNIIRDFNMIADYEGISATLEGDHETGVFSKQRNFVQVIKEALSHDIFLEIAMKDISFDSREEIKKLSRSIFGGKYEQ